MFNRANLMAASNSLPFNMTIDQIVAVALCCLAIVIVVAILLCKKDTE